MTHDARRPPFPSFVGVKDPPAGYDGLHGNIKKRAASIIITWATPIEQAPAPSELGAVSLLGSFP